MNPAIYLDNNSTTPLDPRVLETMLPYLREQFGNSASRSHTFGMIADEAVENARSQVSRTINAPSRDIIWTSGTTESNNLAIKGVAAAYQYRGLHLITQSTEHSAVLDPCRILERQGFRITYLPVDQHGLINPDQLQSTIQEDTILVSIMAANNEIGTIQPLAAIGNICRQRGVLFHTDAAQALIRIPLDVEAMNIDLLSAGGHKVYGPKGVGFLYIRGQNPRVKCEPLLHGGGHERNLRSGTLNVAGIVGLGRATEIGRLEMDDESARLVRLRNRMWDQLRNALPTIGLNGHPVHRLPNTLNICFSGVEGEKLMTALPQIAVSSGSACSSTDPELSHVLKALGRREEQIRSSIRFSLGRFNTAEEVSQTVQLIIPVVRHLQELNRQWEKEQPPTSW